MKTPAIRPFIVAAPLVAALFILSDFCSYVIAHSPHFDFATATCSAIQSLILWINMLAMTRLLEAIGSRGWAGLAPAPAPVAAGAAFAVLTEGQTEVTLKLEEYPAHKKVSVIRVIRECTGLGTKEAKDLIEGAPSTVKVQMAEGDFEVFKKKLEETGSKVQIQ